VDSDELRKLLLNLSEPQRAAVAAFAVRLATISAQKWTGEIAFKLQVNQGGITDGLKVNQAETIRISKKRKVRSRGI